MRVFAALLAVLATGSTSGAAQLVAVTMDAHPRVARGCALTNSATIVAYDARAAREVFYRFVRSDGSASPVGRIAFSGDDGAVAQSVSDTWTPRGAAPWIALEVVSPGRLRSARLPLTPPCARQAIAATK